MVKSLSFRYASPGRPTNLKKSRRHLHQEGYVIARNDMARTTREVIIIFVVNIAFAMHITIIIIVSK